MEITEVRIKLMEDGGERLQGFCSITFDDCFVVRGTDRRPGQRGGEIVVEWSRWHGLRVGDGSTGWGQRELGPRPVVDLFDDLRLDDLGRHGAPGDTTPPPPVDTRGHLLERVTAS